MKSYLHNIAALLSGPWLLNFILPVLMVYLLVGTVAQKYIGLYESTKLFFSNWLLWLGPVPLPGLPILLGLIFINLGFKLFYKSPWRLRDSGIITTHIGAMLLLLGGLFTALFSSEGYMDLTLGNASANVNNYHAREFVLVDADGKNIKSFAHNEITVGRVLEGLPFKVEILETCRNCKITARENADDSFMDMAQHMQLSDDTPEMQNEMNMAGLTYRVSGSENDGAYVALENVPRFPSLKIGEQTYHFVLRKAQSTLPFSIELIDFKKEVHPGTEMAKSYQSRVRIHDGPASWESLISMNEPLRYKGYSFFQSSFIETPNGPVSVLAAVWNAGRAFPYISGIAMCIGIILHLFLRRRYKEGEDNNAA